MKILRISSTSVDVVLYYPVLFHLGGTHTVKNSRIFDVGNLEVVNEMTNEIETDKNKLRYLYIRLSTHNCRAQYKMKFRAPYPQNRKKV